MTCPTSPFLCASAAVAACLIAAPVAFAQNTTQTTTRHTTSTTPAHRPAAPLAAKSASDPADNPPGVPPVTATPKALYSLRYVDITVGDGPLAPPQKYYTVKYTGWLTDGTKFDSSYDHPGADPITFPIGAHRVIPGWDTGFAGMRVGGKRRLYIPWQLAYGDQGRDPIPPRANLIFDIELVGFGDTPTPTPPTPAPATSTPPTGSSSTPDAPAPQGSANPQ